MSILIVDDDPTIRDLATLFLNEAGFEVDDAKSADEAFALLGIEKGKDQTINPDVILMDIMMPEIDGIEATARIKMDERYADTPILMVTSLKDVEYLKKAFMAGATDYMNKPIRKEELLARVRAGRRFKQELDRRKEREKMVQINTEDISSSADQIIEEQSGLLNDVALAKKLDWVVNNNPEGIVIIVGLDYWDNYTSRYNNNERNAALQKVSNALSEHSSQLGDTLFCLKGGKYAVFFPNLKGKDIEKVAEETRLSINKLNIDHAFSPIGPKLTASSVALGITKNETASEVVTKLLSLLDNVQQSGGNNIYRLEE